MQHKKLLFDVEQYIYYARDYSSLASSAPVKWFFRRLDYTLINQEELASQCGGTWESMLGKLDGLIPFAEVDIISLEHKYLQEYFPGSKHVMDCPDPDAAFKRMIERSHSQMHWHDYEKKVLRACVIKWCKENKICHFLR